MASEPITLYSWNAVPAEVLAAIRERYPEAEVAGQGDDWRTITVRSGSGKQARALSLLHEPDYYSGPNWPSQQSGMQAYFDRFPGGPALKAKIRELIGSFHFALGTRFEPDYDDPTADDRFAIITGVTRLIDGVIFTPSGLCDPDGRILMGVDGATDVEAQWPQVRAEAPAVADGVLEAGPAGAEPPSADRAAQRAVALMGVTARAVIEREVRSDATSAKEALKMQQSLLDWLAALNLEQEFEPVEWAIVKQKPGKLTEEQFRNALWRIEGLAVLAWALGRGDRPQYDALADIDGVWGSLGFLQPVESKVLLAAATLRPLEQLQEYRKQVLGLHWRLRDYTLNPKIMDFLTFSRDCWFGAFDATDFDLVDNDLAFQGDRIDKLAPSKLGNAMSIARERHHAINWLCFGPKLYSETYVGT